MSEQGISDFDDFWGLGCDKGVSGDAAEPTPLKLRAAADAIAAADFLLIAAGAGFSAQSGLRVYKDLADVLAYKDRGLDYADLAQPHWRHSEPGVFFGFMGNNVPSCQTSRRVQNPAIVVQSTRREQLRVYVQCRWLLSAGRF